MSNKVKLIECPRDAMQGWTDFIPTMEKIRYLNTLLKVGFDTLDFGSFVSPKAIPQMQDTKEVLKGLIVVPGRTKLLAIIANLRGAEEAAAFDTVSILGFPFSVSEEFQKRNTNSSIRESLKRVEEIQAICTKSKKELLIYISMGFGNPYGEEWNPGIVIKWVKELVGMGVNKIALADTIGVSNPGNIRHLFSQLIPEFPKVEFGAHLHSSPDSWEEKVKSAFDSGCRRFDSAMKGIGGCPMAKDELVGNLATENLVNFFDGPASLGLDEIYFKEALQVATEIFH